MKRQVDIAIIGGGAAGLAAAAAAYDEGARNIAIFERESAPGGILKQCIHNGFGLHRFNEELTGPEYASREAAAVSERGIEIEFEATVLSLSSSKRLTVVSPTMGFVEVQAKAVILAMGSRERTRGPLRIAGTRPAGIYTAGTAQHMINLEGIIPGNNVVMLGSGDIGLIVARRLAYEGANVKAVYNRSHFSGGLKRNIVQCLDDYGIPLKFLHTITSIYGKDRLEAVGVYDVDKATKLAIPGTEKIVECDTLLLSVGLIPENELTSQAGIPLDRGSSGASVDEMYQTSTPGVFSAGNVLHIHDLVDYVSEEGEGAGRAAARYVLDSAYEEDSADAREEGAGYSKVVPGNGVKYVVPQRISSKASGRITLRFRVRDVYKDAKIKVLIDGREIKSVPKRVLVPAEMAQVKIPSKDVSGSSNVEVSIEFGGE